ncbi:MAG: mitochondrial fission ELM1 family protein [Alphaproteobacteria bacterium]|jgi:mitochondrial fission protein ELM1
MYSDKIPRSCWVVCDAGKIGTLNQCIGLAEALGFVPKIFEVRARSFWSLLPASLWPIPLSGTCPALTAPWPELIIAAGRASVAPTAQIRRLTLGTTKVVQLQNPRIEPSHFDAVIAPAHDHLKGQNVITTKGALHRVTKQKIQESLTSFEGQFAHLPRPIITVLIGGSNRCYRITPNVMHSLVDTLKIPLSQLGGSLAVTVSRRTELDNIEALRQGLRDVPHYLWDGQGDNPYFSLLGIADYIVVTSDSVSMTSEACALGTPVYVYHLPGGSKKFRSFHRSFENSGLTKPLSGPLSPHDVHEPLFEMDNVVTQLKQIINIPR